MKLTELKAKLEEAKKALQETGKQAMAEEFKAFFDANPDILALRWAQYTPYFNDGDACHFHVREMYYKVRPNSTPPTSCASCSKPIDADGKFCKHCGAMIQREPLDDDWQESYGNNPPTNVIVRMFEKSISDEDIMQTIFGDHVCVTATREGFEVEEYDHE